MSSEKVNALLKNLEQGVADVVESQQWADLLVFQSKFHKYSFNNVFLIKMQCPQASMVAGFHGWLKMHRYVKKGETGIAILAPLIKKLKEKKDNGEEKESFALFGFKVVHVFDVSQTDGEPLPEHPARRLDSDSAAGQWLFDQMMQIAPCEVKLASLGGPNGLYYLGGGPIMIEESAALDQKAKTLIHEICHAYLDQGKRSGLDRQAEEVVVEGAAYVVCQFFGLDTSGYSFGYVASYGGKPEVLLKLGNIIQELAGKIIEQVEVEKAA